MPDIKFDSGEEEEFYAWCEEAVTIGVLESFIYHPEPFKLSDRATYTQEEFKKGKTKTVEKFLMHPHEYTPDFKLKFTKPGGLAVATRGTIPPPLMTGCEIIADIKAKFSRFHDAKPFSIDQKWVFAKYGIYVHKIIPEEWFTSLWVPHMATITKKTGKPRMSKVKGGGFVEKYANVPTLHTFTMVQA